MSSSIFSVADWRYADRALQVALRVILRTTSRLEVNGPLRYAKMPEMGLISCPLKIKSA